MANVLKKAYQEYLHSSECEQLLDIDHEAMQKIIRKQNVNMVGKFSSKEVMKHTIWKTLQEQELLIQTWLSKKPTKVLIVKKDFLTKIGDGCVKGTNVSRMYAFYTCELHLRADANGLDFHIIKASPAPNVNMYFTIQKDKAAFFNSTNKKKKCKIAEKTSKDG